MTIIRRTVGTLTKVLVLPAAVLAGSAVAHAVNPHTVPGSHAGCDFSGQSEYFVSTIPYDYAETGQTPFLYCNSLLGVYAYFWGSDSQYHFRDGGWISGQLYGANSVLWEYWTDNIFGYHQVQKPVGTYSTKLETHAY